MHFVLIFPPGSRVSVGFSRRYYPTKTPGTCSSPGGRAFTGVLTYISGSTSSWARTIRSILAKVGILSEEDPGTSSFWPSRDNPDLSPSFLPLPQNLRVSREREKEREMFANLVDNSSVLLSVVGPHLPYFDQVPRLILSNKGWRNPRKGFKSSYLGLFQGIQVKDLPQNSSASKTSSLFSFRVGKL